MKQHQETFNQIKVFLLNQFGKAIKESEGGNHLRIGESGIWISCDEFELTIGYGINHRHYFNEEQFIAEAVENFFNLLTKRKRRTEFIKRKKIYKIKIEIEGKDGGFNVLSESMFWLYPFWKKTEKRVTIDEKLLDYSSIAQEVIEIKKSAQQYSTKLHYNSKDTLL